MNRKRHFRYHAAAVSKPWRNLRLIWMEVLLLVGCIYFNTRAEKVDVETMGTIGLLLLLIIVASQQLDTKPGSRP